MPTYRFTDSNRTNIIVTEDDGTTKFVPTDPDNMDYRKILDEGIEVEPYDENA